jgi:minor histocompatibility antigen H13
MDLPIKLMVPDFSSGRMSMLGLGDIALPGAMVAYALRCDLLFNQEKVAEDSNADESSDSLLDIEARFRPHPTHPSGTFATTSSTAASGAETALHSDNKAKTTSGGGGNGIRGKGKTALFNHAMLGYLAGIISAFVGNKLSGHAQPALIYLVPGVLLSIVGKAWQMGRLAEVWTGPPKLLSA